MSGHEDEIAWRAWPLKRDPVRGVGAVLVIAGACYGVWNWTSDPWLLVLAVAVLSVAVGRFFVPTRYRLSSEGIEIRRPWRRRVRRWREFRGIRSDDRLAFLTPLTRSSLLQGIRGETLLLEGNGGEVRAYVEEMVGKTTGAGDR